MIVSKCDSQWSVEYNVVFDEDWVTFLCSPVSSVMRRLAKKHISSSCRNTVLAMPLVQVNSNRDETCSDNQNEVIASDINEWVSFSSHSLVWWVSKYSMKSSQEKKELFLAVPCMQMEVRVPKSQAFVDWQWDDDWFEHWPEERESWCNRWCDVKKIFSTFDFVHKHRLDGELNQSRNQKYSFAYQSSSKCMDNCSKSGKCAELIRRRNDLRRSNWKHWPLIWMK